MIEKIKQFKEKHANLYEFIMFNLLSNIATITNFVVLNLCMSFIFVSLATTDFNLWIFNYSTENGGLAGFLSFLVSFFAAQAVNFIVQRKLVFNANNKLGAAIPIYLFTVIVVYVICMYIPTIVLGPISSVVGSFWGTNITNAINIMVQVIIIYPVLKFVVMKKVPEQDEKTV
ncbi:hypothetical protein [Radiobacillus sp. PE A8.2]|uniref:hypothetical protein n=1 Tax=Radiobacillus sp. PE A8.2 TaxID=3380349 RepID=UPI00388E767C